MATATTARMIQKFREKRKILGNPIPSPFVFLFSLSPACFICDKTQSSAGSACGSSAWMYPRRQRCVCVCREHTERAGLAPPGCCGPDHPLFPKKNRTWPWRAPRCKRSLLRSAPKQRDPPSERDFRLEDISPAVKKVEGNLSIVLEVLRV